MQTIPRTSLQRSSVTRDVVWADAVTLLACRVLQTSNLKLPTAPFGIVRRRRGFLSPGAGSMQPCQQLRCTDSTQHDARRITIVKAHSSGFRLSNKVVP